MPVTGLFASAASFFYAVSTLLNGAQDNAAVQDTLLRNYESSSSHFVPRTLKHSPIIEEPAVPQALLSQPLHVDLLPPIATAIYSNEGSKINGSSNNTDVKNSFEPTSLEDTNAPKMFNHLLSTRLKSFSRANIQPIELNYYDGQTIATVFTDVSGKVSRCKLTEINQPEEIKKTLQKLAYEKKIIEKTSFRAMLAIITACQTMEPPEISVQTPLRNNSLPLISADKQYNMWSIVSGILPGTKWCGLGDIAQNYDDLGEDRELDKCCRAHDHCPKKIKAFRRRYGLVNWSLYTKSHCECDSLLHHCLKNTNSVAAEMLGNFYFNVLKMQCIEEDKARCAQENKSGWRHKDHKHVLPKLIFKEVHLEF